MHDRDARQVLRHAYSPPLHALVSHTIFLAIALLSFFSSWRGDAPFLGLSGDSANIAAFSAPLAAERGQKAVFEIDGYHVLLTAALRGEM